MGALHKGAGQGIRRCKKSGVVVGELRSFHWLRKLECPYWHSADCIFTPTGYQDNLITQKYLHVDLRRISVIQLKYIALD